MEKDFKYHQKGCHECVCEECNETFDHEQKLKRHKDSYKCDHYQKTFAEKRNLTRYKKSYVILTGDDLILLYDQCVIHNYFFNF